MRKTKIICTIDPARSSEETIEKMIAAGMNVARFNFSHGTHADHKRQMDTVKRVREKLNAPVAILLDTKGPEYRIGTFEEHKVILKEEDIFTFTAEDCIGDESRVSVSYKNLPDELSVRDTIVITGGQTDGRTGNTSLIKYEVLR